MNKRDAKEILCRETITVANLKTILEKSSSDHYRRSVVNPGFSLADTHDIFTKALDDWPEDRIIRPSNSRDMLIATNIIRDFGVAPLFEALTQ